MTPKIISLSKPIFYRGGMIRLRHRMNMEQKLAAIAPHIDLIPANIGELIDIYIGQPPSNIEIASFCLQDGVLHSTFPGNELDAVTFGSCVYSRYRIARRSEDGDFNGSVFLGTILSSCILRVIFKSYSDVAFPIIQDIFTLQP